jgi:hypothetical protein
VVGGLLRKVLKICGWDRGREAEMLVAWMRILVSDRILDEVRKE